jgi:hypothetical protein
MNEPLFMFAAHGIAAEATSYRAGARHALMFFAKGPDIASARATAEAGARARGWTLIDVQREKKIDSDPSVIADDILRSAAEAAVRVGHSTIVYKDELPLDS